MIVSRKSISMKNQIEKTLPRSAWDAVTIYESGEPLVEVQPSKKIILGLEAKQYQASFMVRKTVAEKLIRVANSLPTGITLVLIEGYRSMEHQKESWDRNFLKLKEEQPTWSDEQITATIRLVIAPPHPLANHHCGGAVDVALAYTDGTLLDMGSPYPSEAFSIEVKKKFPMFPNSLLSKLITREQESNRAVLREAMEQEDFVWYPNEWWHYCYGDRMWAVYSRQEIAIYGSIELE